jgi:aconitate hydratase
MSEMKTDFTTALTNKVGFKGYGLNPEHTKMKANFKYNGKDYTL